MPSRRSVLERVLREVTAAFTVDEVEALSIELAAFVKARRLAEKGLLTVDSLDVDSSIDWIT